MDAELIVRVMSGDRDAFATLVQSTHARLYRTAALIVRDPELAADAVQDALLAVWVDARAIRDPARFDAWLNRLLIRACVRAARKVRQRSAVEIQVLPSDRGSSDASYALVGLRDEIARAFEQLTIEHRAVLVTHHYLELGDGEAAAALEIPLGTYKSRLHRAGEAMRAVIEAADRTPGSPPGELKDVTA